MSKFDEMHVRWTARLIDPLKSDAVADGSGFTPDEALQHLREQLKWKADRERASAGQLEAALEFALYNVSDTVPHV